MAGHVHPGHRWAGRRPLDLGRLLIGLTIATLGLLFLLDSAGALNADRAIDRWWPVILIAAGVFTLIEHSGSTFRGALLTGIGAVALLFTTDVLGESDWSYVWPAILILAGVVIVARWAGRSVPAGAREQDVVRATGVFGGPNVACTSRQFRGGWLTAIFGGVTLDLREAQLVPDGASINATVAFGGIDILVPKGWRISTRSTPIFGGFDDKTEHAGPLPDDAPTLSIDAVIIFGGVAVKHEK